MKTLRLLLLAACCAAAPAQVATGANERYQTPEGRKAMIGGLSSPTRDATQRPRELVEAMDLKPGMTVADVGTGPGYMLPYLSQAVGPTGQVLAEDIFDDFLSAARKHATDEHLANVTFVHGTETDPHLGDDRVDAILALDSYHHYDYPEKMLAAFHHAMRAGGRLFIVEYYKRPNAMQGMDATKHIRLDEPDLVREVERNGFRKIAEREQIKDSQYMVTFTPVR